MGFAVKGLVDGLAKSVPQFLFLTPVNRHLVGLRLPALLQRAHGVNAQHGRLAQGLGFFNHGAAHFQALGLQGFQRSSGSRNGGFPERLQFGKGFFAQVTGIAPAVAKLVQQAAKAFPVAVARGAVFFGPGIEFGNQGQALVAVLHGVGLELFQPGFHHFVGFVAGFIKAFPHGVVGHATLVGLFPLLAHGAQGFLHLAPTDGLAFGALEQAFGLDQQLFAQLVGAPALPAFEFACGSQGGLGLVFKLVVDHLAKFLERLAQGAGRAGAGFALAFAGLHFELRQHFAHLGVGGFAHFGVNGHFGRLGAGRGGGALGAQLFGPNAHAGQRSGGVLRGG